MTFADWLDETGERYRTQSPLAATRESAHEFRMGLQRRVGSRLGKSIWGRGDWDVLVVLDACRNDMWNEVYAEYDRLERSSGVWSNASCSIDWIVRNFNEHPEQARRAGYVTGNPFAHHTAPEARSADLSEEDLAHFAPLYKSEWTALDGGPVETIPPKVLTDHAIDAWRRRDKLGMDRLIIHYMQPHQPFRSKPEWEKIGKNLKNLVDDRGMAGACAWQRARRGEVDTDELWAAALDNLHWVLDDVTERLLPNIDGTVALTADHGNAMGEWGEWAHPPGAISPAVRTVPWVALECVDDRTVTPDVESNDGRAAAEDQLEALGYL